MNAITSAPQRPLQGTHAGRAGDALRQALTASHSDLRAAVEGYRTARAGLAADADLLDAMRATAEVVLAAEAIVAAGKQLEATARAALTSCMVETGCPAVALDSHTVHLSTKPARVDIEDERAIPPELMRTPPPAPDKVAIGKLLRAGVAVPGARLIGNQEPMCVFKVCQ